MTNQLMNHKQEHKQMKELTTIRAVGECLAVIAELHPSWKYDVNLTPKLWHDALKHYPEHIVKRSVLDLAQTSKYVPKLAEVLERIKESDNLPPKYLGIETNNNYTEYDKWWLSLSDNERVESHQRQEDWVNGLDVELSDLEITRAQLLKDIKELIKEL